MLQHLGTKTLIIGGFAGNVCCLFTANDAYMNDFSLLCPIDCMGCTSKEEEDATLLLMERVLKVNTKESHLIDLDILLRKHKEVEEQCRDCVEKTKVTPT